MLRRFDLPRPRWIVGWPAAAVAVAAHAVLLALFLVLPRATYQEEVRFIYIGGDAGDIREVPLPSLPRSASPADAARGTPRPGPERVAAARPTQAPAAGLEPADVEGDSLAGVVAAAGAGEGLGAGGAAEGDSAPSTPSPRLGNASLWVRPLRLAQLSDEAREAILSDPAVAVRLQAIFDSIRSEPGAEQALPKWATEIPGIGPIGLDSGWVTVGPIRIPAAVLALIPLPQGNIEEAERAERLAEMRFDLMQAARRAATVAEFKQVVRELRERKDRERAAERARRGRDTIIP